MNSWFNIFLLLLTCLLYPSECRPQDISVHDQIVNIESTITAVSLAELNISETRVTKTVTWTLNFLAPTTLEERKKNLLTELCQEVGADIILDPQFSFSKRILGGGKLTVSGYPAKYTNFRNMTEDEIKTFIISHDYPSGTVIIVNKQ